QSEHPPRPGFAVVPLAEAEVNDGISLGVQIPAADGALHRRLFGQPPSDGFLYPGRPGDSGLGRCSPRSSKQNWLDPERDLLLHYSSSSSRTSSTATIRARDGSINIRV